MIGILGGTFDPIHFGHLRPALEIFEQLGLDELRLIPSAKPPHRWQPEASEAHRLAMVKIAVKGVDGFIVDDREYHREGASYTVDTLASIRDDLDKKKGESEPLCMFIGMDAFEHFTTWHDWQEILNLAHLVISSRPGTRMVETADWMENRITEDINDLQKASAGKLYFADVSQYDLSATFLRKQILAGKSSQYATPVKVSEYIKQNKLYI
ncbi:MAG: nicotinate-nucleotide adenylyltransferase [Cocleimonas sp.]|nr:nicotinate-nucleotide adenylyltransferase [Cocleimonas sp.]